MPFETRDTAPRRIAVVGGGVSGLGAAWYLSANHRVVLFEAEPRLGGHARTVTAGRRADQPVDTGFIVFNRVNYPLLTTLFDDLGVATVPSKMSFGASIGGGWLEYALTDWGAIFAQRRNLVRPAFLRMLDDIRRFNAGARGALTPGATIGDLTGALELGDWFTRYYLAPFSGAIWSTPTERILDFPAEALVRFFENHALLDYGAKRSWETVAGGSANYVARLAAALRGRGVEMRQAAPVAGVRRRPAGPEVRVAGGDWEGFDEVVLATHSDSALAVLADATPSERQALAAVRYQTNRAVLHADPSVMPRRRRCWSSWVYTGGDPAREAGIGLTYWMNSLQPIPADDPLFVTLNPTRPIRGDLVHDETEFAHPLYDLAGFAGRERLRQMNGTTKIWFCGAWLHDGFHEDGLRSAWDVAAGIGAEAAALAVAAE